MKPLTQIATESGIDLETLKIRARTRNVRHSVVNNQYVYDKFAEDELLREPSEKYRAMSRAGINKRKSLIAAKKAVDGYFAKKDSNAGFEILPSRMNQEN